MEIDIKGYKVLIDDEDYERIMAHGWSYKDNRHPYFHASISKISPIPTPLHRFIMECIPGDGVVIDHIDGNTLDNRKRNLRRCTHKGNNRNCIKPKNNTSGYKGVRLLGSFPTRYHAFIKVNYKQLSLNMWDTLDEAARAYDIASLYYFGEFAKLNFPVDNYSGIDLADEMSKLIHRIPRRNSSGTVGVRFRNDTKKWTTGIWISKTSFISLGCFSTIEEAIDARKEAEIRYGRVNKHERPILSESEIHI